MYCLALPLLATASSIDFEADFLSSLDEVTEIATKTKLNIDDAPAFVTVLQQNKLLNLGANTIYDALAYVPGVQLSMESSGVPVVIFRGVTQKGEVKLMIDGVSINNAYRGSIYYYLDFPIELIERIEVIRGPGSVLYGSNAISGVINVVTKNSDDSENSSLFASAGSFNSYRAGGHIAHNLENVHLSLDAYYQNGNKHIYGGPDKAEHYGKSDQSLEDYSIGLHLKSGAFELMSRLKNSTAGMAFGVGNYFESQNDLGGNQNQSLFAKIKYTALLDNSNELEAALTYNQYSSQVETRFAPLSDDVDVLYFSDYQERSQELDLTLHNNSLNDHAIILGAEYKNIDATKTALNVQNHPQLDPDNLIKPDVSRQIYSLFINDQFTLSQNSNIVAGIRYDNYSDYGGSLSPRLALVHKYSNSIHFKAMYSRSFRAPSWIELYAEIPGVSKGNEHLKAETSDTLEVGLIHKSSKHTLRLNAFISQIDNMIYKEGVNYVQNSSNNLYGAELEWQHIFSTDTSMDIIGSYVDVEDKNSHTTPNYANILTTASLSHLFAFNIQSYSSLHYTSSINRAQSDIRNDMDATVTFDQSFSYTADTVTLVASVKNLFNEELFYAAFPNTYVNDYPAAGRTVTFKMLWSF